MESFFLKMTIITEVMSFTVIESDYYNSGKVVLKR